jgi:hypothetical protein
MKLYACLAPLAVSLSLFVTVAQTQDSRTAVAPLAVEIPKLIKFYGTARDEAAKPISGVVGVTFSLYRNQFDPAPLWTETQNVQADINGHYTAMLGASTSTGIPLDIFSSAEAHWIGTQISGQREQPRVLLLSVPYALKAVDAETLGGLPASAFVRTNPEPTKATAGSAATTTASLTHATTKSNSVPPTTTVTGAGTTNYLPIWTSASALGNSALFQTSGNVGVGTTAPGAKLDSTGASIAVRGTSAGTTGVGVVGKASSTTGVNFGVKGTTASTAKGSAGVTGISSATTGSSAGVLGHSASPNAPAVLAQGTAVDATAVLGQALSITVGVTIDPTTVGKTPPQMGVEGVASSTQGIGVAGISSQYGVFGQAQNGAINAKEYAPAGVFGYAPGLTSVTFGVQGMSASPTGAGVYGNDTSLTGVNNGVLGSTSSPTNFAAGVSGNEGSTSGQVYGVVGVSNSTTDGAAAVNGYEPAITGQVFGVNGSTASGSNGAAGVQGYAAATTGQVFGVNGSTASVGNGSAGVNGYEGATTGQVFGVNGYAATSTDYSAGVAAFEGSTSGIVFGVSGSTNSTTDGAAGVNGYQGATTGQVFGVSGVSNSATNFSAGVVGNHLATTGIVMGVLGQSNSGSDAAAGVVGVAASSTGTTHGIRGIVNSPQGTSGFFMARSTGKVLDGFSYTGPASSPVVTEVFRVDGTGNGYFAGNLNVTGKLTKGSGSFKIDDPLDPAHKYLSHSFVESPDMMNVYNGNIITDKHGLATVVLPEYFEALNRDFRYQLTVIGQFAQAIVARKISNNCFVVRTSKPGVEVSWQVTGIRHDAYADANRIPVEEEKPPQEQGHYLHPELFTATEQLAREVAELARQH